MRLFVGFERFLTRRKRSTSGTWFGISDTTSSSCMFRCVSMLWLAKDRRRCRTSECPYFLYAIGAKGVRCESDSRADFTFI